MVMSLSPNQTGDVPTQPQASGLGRIRNVVLLFAAQGSSFMGGGVKTIALVLFAYELTGGELRRSGLAIRNCAWMAGSTGRNRAGPVASLIANIGLKGLY